MPRFFQSVAQEPSANIRDYVLLSLLTGARRSNGLSMRWADVHMERGEWRIPHHDSKNGEPITVPLMPEAVEILKSRKPNGPAVFEFPRRGKSGHMQDAKKGWQSILDRDELSQFALRIKSAGGEIEWPLVRVRGPRDKSRKFESLTASLERAQQIAGDMGPNTTGVRLGDLRINDMRRTLGSWQVATGASLVVIGKSLGHKDTASTMIYSRFNLDPVRDLMQSATRAMLAAGGLLPTAAIVPFDKAKLKTA